MSRLPIVWALGCVVVLGVAFWSVSWPYVDAYNNLNEASRWTWSQYVRYAFGGGTEYRPLLTLGTKLAYEVVGLHLWVYQAVVLLQYAAVLGLLVWLFRPIGTRRGMAAAVAIACVVGLHSTRILFFFVPLNAHSAALVLVLVAVALAVDPRARAFDWIFFPLTLVALPVLESSLLIAPLVAVLWWLKAPGVSARAVAGVAAAVIVYLAVRFTFGVVQGASIYTGSGLGLSFADPETLRDVFQRAPWLFWVYNVVATFLTVAASEPRAGVYEFVKSLLGGETPLWRWWHVGSSVLTTVVMAAALRSYRPASSRDRLLLGSGLVLVVFGSALGFLYTRDRIAISAGVGYAIVLYVAIAALLDRLPASGWRRPVLAAVTGVIACAWVVRSAEAYVQLRDLAWDYHLEWTTRYEDLGGPAQPQIEILTSMRSAALRDTPDNPRLDPAWTFMLFERRYSPQGEEPAGNADAAADNAVPTLSPPFNVRWKLEADDASRVRLEAVIGLVDGRPVTSDPRGRTWSYRLRRPTPDRVRTLLRHPLVEDTARIDAARLEIVE